jgi:alpha-tubulin suppressor-like RCC1 family protein
MQLGTAPETTCQPGPLAGDGAGIGPATLPTPHPEPCTNTPQRLFGIAAVAIDAEADQTCVVIDDGTVRCWGTYDPVAGTIPAQIDGIDSRVVAVDVGYGHACALTEQDGVLCWGNNYRGQLGDGNGGEFGDYSRTAVAASGLGSGVRAITAGGGHSCALMISGAVKCWGVFLVGDGSRFDRTTPVDISNVGDGIGTLTAGAAHICALLKSGALKCWGSNIDGALGVDPDQTKEIEAPINGPDLTSPLNIYAGGFGTCAVLTDGALECWGRNDSGQLGDGSTDSRSVPAGVSGFDAKPLPTAAPPQAGDANCDGLISAIDGALILQFGAALLPALPCPEAADASGDGRVDARDALLVLQRIAGLAASARG